MNARKWAQGAPFANPWSERGAKAQRLAAAGFQPLARSQLGSARFAEVISRVFGVEEVALVPDYLNPDPIAYPRRCFRRLRCRTQKSPMQIELDLQVGA